MYHWRSDDEKQVIYQYRRKNIGLETAKKKVIGYIMETDKHGRLQMAYKPFWYYRALRKRAIDTLSF